MQLRTDELRAQFPALYAQENTRDSMVYAKFFILGLAGRGTPPKARKRKVILSFLGASSARGKRVVDESEFIKSGLDLIYEKRKTLLP